MQEVIREQNQQQHLQARADQPAGVKAAAQRQCYNQCRDCTVKYQYKQGDAEQALEWQVSASGEIQPLGEIAAMTDRALRLETDFEGREQGEESE